METNTQRVEEFKQEVASMHLSAPVDANERNWLLVGIGLAVAGIVFIVFGWYGASGEADVAKQIPYIISGAVVGLGFVMAGCALFLRYSLGRYLRFWLVRDLYEQRAQTDRIIEALHATGRGHEEF